MIPIMIATAYLCVGAFCVFDFRRWEKGEGLSLERGFLTLLFFFWLPIYTIATPFFLVEQWGKKNLSQRIAQRTKKIMPPWKKKVQKGGPGDQWWQEYEERLQQIRAQPQMVVIPAEHNYFDADVLYDIPGPDVFFDDPELADEDWDELFEEARGVVRDQRRELLLGEMDAQWGGAKEDPIEALRNLGDKNEDTDPEDFQPF